MAIRESTNLKSVPPGGVKKLDEVIPGALPLPAQSEMTCRYDDAPIAQIPGEILASYAWHALHLAVSFPTESEAKESAVEHFLVNRSSASYKFWAIPPVNDFATVSIEDGLKAILLYKEHGFFPGGDLESGVLCRTACSQSQNEGVRSMDNLSGPGGFEVEVTYQRGKAPFFPWKREGAGGEEELVTLTPVLFCASDSGKEDSLGWVDSTDPGKEVLLAFDQGWDMIRSDKNSNFARSFERLYQKAA